VGNIGIIRHNTESMESGKNLGTFNGDNALLACSISPDGKTIIAGGVTNSVHFLRLEGGKS